jgi:YVTN family beta-propeller protein
MNLAQKAAFLGLLLWALTVSGAGSVKEPIYIGTQACAQCHDSSEIGHQFSKWRLSAHAAAYASLALPEAKTIAEFSGIPEEPQKARMCLGCHTTAAETEEWEKAEGFHLEDGLQCEGCHGPGSEYSSMEMMKDRAKAMANGLRMPDKDSCMACHRTKGSHDMALKKNPFNLDMAWQAISHPTAKAAETKPKTTAMSEVVTQHKFVGVMACAKCHGDAQHGFQFSQWRTSKHAQAFAVLASSRAVELAGEAGVKGDPQNCEQCLKCHATGAGSDPASFLKDFGVRDGVQCESCHGPGADYSPEAVMLDKVTARAKGLWAAGQRTCSPCHEKAHGKRFDYETALKKIAHSKKMATGVSTGASANSRHQDLYKNPLNLALTPDGKELWVACEVSSTVVVVDTANAKKVAEVAVGGQPTGVCFAPDGKRAFVSNRLDDSVSVVKVASRKVIATLEVGNQPHGVLVDRQGRYLYVLNTSIDNISVFDLATLKEIKRLSASRSPWSLAQSPNGHSILVTHALSRFVPDRTPSMSEVTVIDAGRVIVEDRLVVPGANLLQGVAWHPSGEFALITLLRTKNLVPMTRINRGWTITNGLGIVWRDGTVDQVLLDQNDLYFPDPTDVCITPDGKYALVTSSSSDRVAIADLDKLIALLKAATPRERERIIPNHLGKWSQFMVKYIQTDNSPHGITCSADGSTAYVAGTLDDAVTVIDLKKLEAVGRIELGGAKELTKRRRGEKLFNSANITFRRQFSCHTCHPDGHIDGIVYDIEDDGIGMGPIDNRSLRGINDTAPFKWTGINPSLKRQCGARLAVFITRLAPFDPEQLDDLHYYLCTIPRPPNRYRKLGGSLTDAQRRGKAIYERTRTNDGRLIPKDNRCATCHCPPLLTDGKIHDVGTKFAYDHEGKFDTPHLQNIYDSAPYLHNGIAPTLEEIWTRYNPYDKHGVTNDMTKDQLNDLIEYLKTL